MTSAMMKLKGKKFIKKSTQENDETPYTPSKLDMVIYNFRKRNA